MKMSTFGRATYGGAALLLAVAGLLVGVSGAAAQEAPTLREAPFSGRPALVPGDRVRVTVAGGPNEAPIEGRVMSLQAGTLVLQTEPASPSPLVLPVESLAHVEVARWADSGAGAVLGMLAGVGIGAVLAAEVFGTGNGGGSLAVVGGAAAGGIGGYYGGRAIERLIVGRRWETVSLTRLRVGLILSPGSGPGLSISYSF